VPGKELTTTASCVNVPDIFHPLTLRQASVAKKTAPKKPQPANFESALKELETLVEDMEQGDISLEESLQKFERGIALSRACQQALQDAEQKVQILIEKKQADTLTDFNEEL
jgi:exodeoxyribonuclease VII small subunit